VYGLLGPKDAQLDEDAAVGREHDAVGESCAHIDPIDFLQTLAGRICVGCDGSATAGALGRRWGLFLSSQGCATDAAIRQGADNSNDANFSAIRLSFQRWA